MIDEFLALGLGALAATLALLFFFLFRQLSEVRRQLSALRVQIGTLRLVAADKNGRPPEDGPPEGARRKGNLWVVPFFLGIFAGLGRWLRRIVSEHPVPAAVAMTAAAATVGTLYLGTTSPHRGGQVAPFPPQVVTHVPRQTHTPSPRMTSRQSARRMAPGTRAVPVSLRPPPGPSAARSSPPTPAPAAPTVAPRLRQPRPTQAPSTAPPAAPAPAASPALAPTPSPTPTSSGLCLRVVVDPVTGVTVCLG